jgi:hypothetical protein
MNAATIETMSLYPTPIGLVVLPDAARINAALGDIIIDQQAASEDGGRPWQWEDGFRQVGGEALTQVLEATRLLADRMTPPRPSGAFDWRVTCRAHVLGRDHSQAVHAHPGYVWSATYVVDDGGIAEQPDLGGVIEFQDPREPEPVMYAPNLTFAVPGGETMGISQTVAPAPGLLVVYPSWLLHGVAVYRGDGKRISIAIELAVDGPATG